MHAAYHQQHVAAFKEAREWLDRSCGGAAVPKELGYVYFGVTRLAGLSCCADKLWFNVKGSGGGGGM